MLAIYRCVLTNMHPLVCTEYTFKSLVYQTVSIGRIHGLRTIKRTSTCVSSYINVPCGTCVSDASSMRWLRDRSAGSPAAAALHSMQTGSLQDGCLMHCAACSLPACQQRLPQNGPRGKALLLSSTDWNVEWRCESESSNYAQDVTLAPRRATPCCSSGGDCRRGVGLPRFRLLFNKFSATPPLVLLVLPPPSSKSSRRPFFFSNKCNASITTL